MDMPLHPMLVHFPIALLITSVLFDAVGAMWKRETFREGALWLLVLGLAGGVAAAVAGDMAEEMAEKAGIAESLIETHETLAFATLGLFGLLMVWRLWLRNHFTRSTMTAYFLAAAIGLGLLSATGHFGGDLVYEHGAGVNVARGVHSSLAITKSDH